MTDMFNARLKAQSMLEDRTLGGVKKESANNALGYMEQAANEEINKLKQELEEYKGKTAREMAELTSKNDRLELNLKRAKDENKAERTTERKLGNGNTEIRRVKANGTVAIKEVTPDGKLVEYSVETLDGGVRHGKFNPATGKPTKTFDNSSGKDMLVEYKDGKARTAKEVNSKKTRKQSPVIVDVKEQPNGSLVRTYSDGAKETISCVRGVTTRRKEKAGNVYEFEMEVDSKHGRYFLDNTDLKVSKADVKLENNTLYKSASIEFERSNYGNNDTVLDRLIKATTTTKKGVVYTLERQQNRYGQNTGMYVLTEEHQGYKKQETYSKGALEQLYKQTKNRYSGGISINQEMQFFYPEAMLNMIDRF